MTFKALVVCGQCEGCDRYTINVRVVYVSKWSNSTSGDCPRSYCNSDEDNSLVIFTEFVENPWIIPFPTLDRVGCI